MAARAIDGPSEGPAGDAHAADGCGVVLEQREATASRILEVATPSSISSEELGNTRDCELDDA